MSRRDQVMFCPLVKSNCYNGQVGESGLTCKFWVGHDCAVYIYLVTLASKQANP